MLSHQEEGQAQFATGHHVDEPRYTARVFFRIMFLDELLGVVLIDRLNGLLKPFFLEVQLKLLQYFLPLRGVLDFLSL